MKIKAWIILLHVIPENANPYDKINERNSFWIALINLFYYLFYYLDGYYWTKKAVFSRAVRGLLNSENERTAVFQNLGNFSANGTESLPRSVRS